MNEQETKEYGIENLKAAAIGSLQIADVIDDIWADKKINFADIAQALRLNDIWLNLKNSPEAFNELMDLSKEETDELRAAVTAEAKKLSADEDSDYIESIVEKALAAAMTMVNLISSFKK